jgi:hypothetical protein
MTSRGESAAGRRRREPGGSAEGGTRAAGVAAAGNALREDRPAIPPVSADVRRPLWSVMIPTYNCASYLREALRSVLSQDPGPDVMQIEVVDDASTQDHPEAVVAELGSGRVGFFRQPQNLGHVGNFNSCLARAQGRIVHLLHGDDYVRPGFYAALSHAFEAESGVGAAFCRGIYMDDDGNWISFTPVEQSASGVLNGWLEKIASGQRIATPSIVVRREVYERLGGFDRRFSVAAEDWEMWVRIAAEYPVYYEREPLAAYRVRRPGSLTQGAEMEPRVVRDMRRAMEIIDAYLPQHLPPDVIARARAQAGRGYADWALQHAYYFVVGGQPAAAARHLAEAFRCSPSAAVVASAARLFGAGSARWLWRAIRRQRRVAAIGAETNG